MTAALALTTAVRRIDRARVPSQRDRDALRAAVVAILRERGDEPPPEILGTWSEILDQFDRLLDRAEALGVPWPEIVCRVNRGSRGD